MAWLLIPKLSQRLGTSSSRHEVSKIRFKKKNKKKQLPFDNDWNVSQLSYFLVGSFFTLSYAIRTLSVFFIKMDYVMFLCILSFCLKSLSEKLKAQPFLFPSLSSLFLFLFYLFFLLKYITLAKKSKKERKSQLISFHIYIRFIKCRVDGERSMKKIFNLDCDEIQLFFFSFCFVICLGFKYTYVKWPHNFHWNFHMAKWSKNLMSKSENRSWFDVIEV